MYVLKDKERKIILKAKSTLCYDVQSKYLHY